MLNTPVGCTLTCTTAVRGVILGGSIRPVLFPPIYLVVNVKKTVLFLAFFLGYLAISAVSSCTLLSVFKGSQVKVPVSPADTITIKYNLKNDSEFYRPPLAVVLSKQKAVNPD